MTSPSFVSLYKTLLTSKDEQYQSYLIKKYLQACQDEDRIHFLRLLLGIKSSPTISLRKLITWCVEYKEIPEWLLRKCHGTTGDWIEALSLVLAKPVNQSRESNDISLFVQNISTFKKIKDDNKIKELLIAEWVSKSADELYLLHKILIGSLKPLIKKQFLARLLHEISNTEIPLIHHRLNELSAKELSYEELIFSTWAPDEIKSKPYAFVFPEIIDRDSFHLGDPEEWIVEPYVHGTRVQLFQSSNHSKVINTDQEIVIIPKGELQNSLSLLPSDTVIELILSDDASVHYITDHHRWNSVEKKESGTLIDRRKQIQSWIDTHHITILKLLPHHSYSAWNDHHKLQDNKGWMIRHIHDDTKRYRIKPTAYVLHAALMYVEYINQNAAIQFNLTLGIHDHENQLIPIAKISGDLLNDMDKNELYYWIQNNTVQRFGPVRLVRSGKYMTLGYERAQINKRVKSGLSLINIKILKTTALLNKPDWVSSVRDVVMKF